MTQEQPRILEANQIQCLIGALSLRGFEVIAPKVRDGAIVNERIEAASDLPAGLTDEQEAGRYRLKERDDRALFGYAVGPQSWKKYLHPADVILWSAERQNGAFHILTNETAPRKPYAFFGVRACDLAAIAVQDRVLLGDKYCETIYKKRREGAFIVVAQCTQAAATCFCASMGTGPLARGGYDLLMTEIDVLGHHRFLVKAGSSRGAKVLAELITEAASDEDLRQAEAAVELAATQQTRRIDLTGIKELLYENFDHPHWEEIVGRCLTCANCTMVCPTCFCTTIEDTSDVTGDHAERWCRQDSCFTLSFSYIHGGSVRLSAKARYRQWITHKLASWIDQFGTSGCVGCGRCITWCPAGIDMTEEARVIRETASHGNS